MKFPTNLILIVACFIFFLLAVACTGGKPRPGDVRPTPQLSQAAGEGAGYPASVWPAVALLETGENPIWFEFGPQGPVHIQSPETASLEAYVPWPQARFVVDIMEWEGFLVMAVNRDGFLVLGSADEAGAGREAASVTRALLYRVSGEFWSPYTIESFFIWRDFPAVLLYRNDFFAELAAPSLRPQVFMLDKSSPVPVGAQIPALERFPAGENWEAEVLRQGPGGYWYYRMREKGGLQNQTAYFRVLDLEGEGVKISPAQWRDSFPAYDRELDTNSLPALPEGFAYTGLAFLRGLVLASWEERLEAGIGAAGFMVKNSPR